MISDRDIYATANVFIKRYGDEAAAQATLRAAEYETESDIDGQRVWLRIIEAIKMLQRTRAPDEAVN